MKPSPDRCDRCFTWPVRTAVLGLTRYCFSCWADAVDPKDERGWADLSWDFDRLRTGSPR